MRKLFSIVQFVVSLSAIISGYGLVRSNGLGMPVEWLGGAFPSFTVPGIILGVVVGGVYLLSSIATWRNHPLSAEASAAAGFGIIIWIFTQLYIVQMTHVLQIVYFGIGILTLVITMLLLKYDKSAKTV